MRLRYKLLLLISLFILFYFIGNWFPIRFLKESTDIFSDVLLTLTTLATFSAVVVALFKDELRKYWRYTDICINSMDSMIEDISNSNDGSISGEISKLKEAEKYYARFEIKNKGNITAEGVELYLDNLVYFEADMTIERVIPTPDERIKWSGTKETLITIPPKAKKYIVPFEILAPVEQSLTDGGVSITPPRLRIGEYDMDSIYNNGTLIASFVLYTSNGKENYFDISIEWNGRWEKRLTDMNDYFKFVLIENN